MDFYPKNKRSDSGMILLSTTMGVFIILSIFAFYLARFSVTENKSSSNYTRYKGSKLGFKWIKP